MERIDRFGICTTGVVFSVMAVGLGWSDQLAAAMACAVLALAFLAYAAGGRGR